MFRLSYLRALEPLESKHPFTFVKLAVECGFFIIGEVWREAWTRAMNDQSAPNLRTLYSYAGAPIQVLLCRCSYTGALLYRCSYTGAPIQVLLYRCSYTGAPIQVLLYRCSYTGAPIEKRMRPGPRLVRILVSWYPGILNLKHRS